jgi:hypothetical protein
MNKLVFVVAIFFVGLLVDIAPAQRAGRSFFTEIDRGCVWRHPESDWGIGSSGELFYERPGSHDLAFGPSGLSVPGCLFVVGRDEVLVGGLDSAGVGLVEHWRFSQGALSSLSSVSLPGKDIVGIVFVHETGVLYLLDAIAGVVCKSQWNPTSPLSSLSLAPWVGQSDVSDLANAEHRTLLRDESSLPPTLRIAHWPFARAEIGVSIAEAVTGVSVGSFRRVLHSPQRVIHADQATASEGGSSVRVWAPAGGALEVIRLGTGAVIGNGVAGAGGYADIALTEVLILGERYTARQVGSGTLPNEGFVCVRRYGYPEVMSDGVGIDSFYFQRGATIGSQFFVEVGLRAPETVQVNRMYTGIMLIGFRVFGDDSVVPYGGNALLVTPFYLPATCMVIAETRWGLAFSSLTIPNDPGLVGLTYLTQFAIEDGSEYRLSEVYGANIEGVIAGSSGVVSAGLVQSMSSSLGQSPETVAAQQLADALLQAKVLDATPVLIQMMMAR